MKMGAERVTGAKNGGGFFHLFDWNKKKTRKKLFATISPEGSKQSRKIFDILPPSTHLRLIVDDGDDGGIVSSVKACSDYSCASSVTDEDGNGNRGGPGVVARLMGLDSMPTTSALEPYSSPIFEPQNLQDRQYQQNCNPGYEMNSRHNFMGGRPVVNSKKKISEMKIQRMPSSPIEKFHTEMLPPRSAKSLPIGHHKLMSPIRNPRFISSKDAADIMEAASKILEPGMIRNTNSNSNIRVPSLGPLRFRDSKESSSLAAATASSQQRTAMILESSKRPVESSTIKYLRGKRSWDGLDCETNCSRVSSSPDMEESKPVTAKSKRKSVSLAIQAKVNVQKREGLSRLSNNKTQVTQEELEEFKSTQPFKNQRNIQTDRLHKKTSTSASSSSVIKQNSRSQRTLIGKEKSSAAPLSVSTCQGRKAFSGETSSFSAAASGTKSVNKPLVNPKSVHRRKGLPRANHEKEAASSTSRVVSNNLNRKKRSIEVDYDSDRSGRSDNLLAGRYEKRIQHNVIVDEQLKQQGEEDDTDKQKNGMDVVSFTFTSPIVKQLSGTQPSMKKWDEYYYPNNSNDKKSPSHGILSKGGGDALSILLDQKLRELTLGLGNKDTNYTTVSISQELSCASENSSGVITMDNDSSTCESGLSSINGQLAMNSTSHKLQEFENQNVNPLSIHESQFSYESCLSSESCSGNGDLKFPSILSSQTSLLEAELEVSDSASSSFRETTSYQNRSGTPRICRKFHSKSYRWEVEYIREMLSVAKLNHKNFAAEYSNETLNPLLFDQLETKTSQSIFADDSDKGERRLNRKAMFDCVKECLDLESQCYFNTADYKMWKKGMMMFVGDFADVLYKKVSGWSSMGDCMVDELVDKDMSSHFGRWVNFETDVFETGVEVEDEILGSLIDEVIAEQLKF